MPGGLTVWFARALAGTGQAWRLAVPLLVAMAISGCAVQLAPGYDPSIVSGLEEANEETMALFAGVSSGVGRGTFSRREDSYNRIIGKLEALRVSAQARPSASGALFLRGRTAGDIPTLESPTPGVLTTASQTITTMRDTDRSAGLTPFVVQGFRQSYELSMQQALTYEKALQR